jgi:hypothetical protein
MKRRLALKFYAPFAAVPLALAVGCGSGEQPKEADPPLGTAVSAICPTAPGAPVLYKNPQYESPVRADSGDLLLLAGDNIRPGAMVIYQAISNTTLPLPVPSSASLPPTNTALVGTIAPLAIGASSVRIALPTVMTTGQSYAFWVANPYPSICGGGYTLSNGVLINDARPMWISPGPNKSPDPVTERASPYPYVYTNSIRPGFVNRDIKIIGRNLQAAPGQQTQVKLSGLSAVVTLTAVVELDPALNHFVARASVPTGLLPEDYIVSVSRDGTSWVQIPKDPTSPETPSAPMRLTVRPEPMAAPPPPIFVSDYADSSVCPPVEMRDGIAGPCSANDACDDTLCITRAIQHASQQGGRDVVFTTGTWTVDRSCWEGANNASIHDEYYSGNVSIPNYFPCLPLHRASATGSIIVPRGVNLVAQPGGATAPTIETRIHFGKAYLDHITNPYPFAMRATLFALLGNNIVQGLRFHEAYKPTLTDAATALSVTAPGAGSLAISGNDVVITDNFFDDTYAGILANGWAPKIDSSLGKDLLDSSGIVITGNTFGVFDVPISFSILEDSVIAGNHFYPGASVAPLAVNVGGSRHLDVSTNVVDGTVTTYSGTTSRGWRAGFFFSSQTAEEHVLVSQNQIKCSGTRMNNDGEAIGTDSNHDANGFKSAQTVTSAIQHVATDPLKVYDAVTVSPASGVCYNGHYLAQSCGPTLPPCPPLYGCTAEMLLSPTNGAFEGHWLHVVSGPGLGQTRKIKQASVSGGVVTLSVSPPFDVMPTTASRITVTQQAWQLYIVSNDVDNSNIANACPLPPNYPTGFFAPYSGGLIGVYGAAADSVIESNTQTNTQGISMNARYEYNYAFPQRVPRNTNQFFVDIRGNTITGSFNTTNGTPDANNHVGGGISLNASVGVLDVDAIVVPSSDVAGFGVSVARNTITNAALIDQPTHDFAASLLISTGGSWSIEAVQPAYVDTLIFGNTVSALPAPWWHNTTYGPQRATVAVSNGDRDVDVAQSGPNYPQATVLCDNHLPATGIYLLGSPPMIGTGPAILDAPYGGNPSTLIQCP